MSADTPDIPDLIDTEDQLDEVLTCPRPVLVDFIRTLAGPLVILGAGGKMGPTLAWLARQKHLPDRADGRRHSRVVPRNPDSNDTWRTARPPLVM